MSIRVTLRFFASPAVGDNDGIPDQYDAVNQLIETLYTSNADLSGRFIEPDYVFGQLVPNGAVALIGLTAGNSNTLGYYTGIGLGTGQTALLPNFSGFGFLGEGTFSNPYPAATLNVSDPIGFYLTSVSSSSVTFFSEPGLNADQYDHMMTFAIPELIGQTIYIDYYPVGGGASTYTFSNPYLIAWEDIAGGGDRDYDDMMYLIDRVSPVPEPTTMLLLGLGLVGLAGVRRFRK